MSPDEKQANDEIDKYLDDLPQIVTKATLPDGTHVLQLTAPPRIGPNDKCPCGSGSKYKRCCYHREDV